MAQLAPGDRYELEFTFSAENVAEFADVTGDTNPLHLDAEYAAKRVFGRPIVHGMFVASLVSRIIGTHLPGEGTIYLSQNLKFTAPVYTDDTVRVVVEVAELLEKGRVRLATRAFRADDTQVMDGEALVVAPRSK